MKFKTHCVVLFASVILFTAACEKETDQNSSQSPDLDFSVAGIDNPYDVNDFLRTLQDSIAKEDKKTVTKMIEYPFLTYSNGKIIKEYKQQDEVMTDYESLFTEDVKNVILKSKPETLFISGKGLMIGNGEVWINNFDGVLKINAINPTGN